MDIMPDGPPSMSLGSISEITNKNKMDSLVIWLVQRTQAERSAQRHAKYRPTASLCRVAKMIHTKNKGSDQCIDFL